MADHNELGKKGEEWARDYLLQKGYEIITTNYKYRKAEIDIIAKEPDGKMMVMVEVKTRYRDALETIHQAVGKTKQKQIIKAAHHYIYSNDISLETQFDIIWINLFANGPEFQHIQDAFSPTL